jgi:predicted PurR-regulated permease PerM
MHKNNASTSALAIVFVAFAVVFIAGLAVVIPAFEEAQAVISIGDQVADVDDIPLAEFAADLIEQALAEIGTEAAPQQEENDGTDSVSVSSQDDANVEEQHSTHTTTQEHVDRNENTQGRVQKQVERQ